MVRAAKFMTLYDQRSYKRRYVILYYSKFLTMTYDFLENKRINVLYAGKIKRKVSSNYETRNWWSIFTLFIFLLKWWNRVNYKQNSQDYAVSRYKGAVQYYNSYTTV